MSVRTLRLDGRDVGARDGQTLLEVARDVGARVPTLCALEGLSDVGACRLCHVEVAGRGKLLPACTTLAEEGMEVLTDTPRLRAYRRQILELLFAERNHVCAVCVANGHCGLQNLALELGMDRVRYGYLSPAVGVDASHRLFALDQNRCVLCTRCVRVCDEVEGAHVWDLMGRGTGTRVVADLDAPWADAERCTSCGKCVMACPTGALFKQGSTVAEMTRNRDKLSFLKEAREKKLWTM